MPDIPPFATTSAGVGATVVATVAIGSVLAEDAGALTSSVNTVPSSIFTDIQTRNNYEEDPHTYMAGITSPSGFGGGQAAFFQLAAPTLFLVCRWTAARYNEQPVIPSKTPSDPNLVYLYGHVETVNVTTGPNGATPLYRISGTYVYGVKNPSPELLDNVSFALDPRYLDAFPNGRGMPRKFEDGNLMQAQDSAAGGGGNNADIPPFAAQVNR